MSQRPAGRVPTLFTSCFCFVGHVRWTNRTPVSFQRTLNYFITSKYSMLQQTMPSNK